VRATLDGARGAFHRRLVVLFQPHRYTRTRDLFDDFARAFNDADVVLVTDVYAAGEEPIEGFDGRRLAEAIHACGHRDVRYVARGELVAQAAALAKEGDLVLTLGAGDITKAGPELLAAVA